MLQAKLLQVYDATEDWRRQRLSEQLVLAINRSDYMLDEPSSTLLQVSDPTRMRLSHMNHPCS